MEGKILNNRYKILKEIGSGGMSTVYLAHCNQLDRRVAIKMLSNQGDSNQWERVVQESKAIARLSHANVVQVYDVFEEGFDQFIVMEYIQGKSLKEILKNSIEPISEKKCIEMGLKIAKALLHAHNSGVIHSDIKPDNIIVDNFYEPRITDFGIAAIVSDEEKLFTQEYGTIKYSSPEQIRCEYIDKRTDIYSFGVLLYEMASLKLPFPLDKEEIIKFKKDNLPIIHPKKTIENISTGFADILNKCISANVDDRYSSMADVIVDLNSLLSNQGTDITKEKSKNRVIPAVIGGTVAVVLILILMFTFLFKSKGIEIENYVNKDFTKVKEELEKKGLKVESKSISSDIVEKGKIISNEPNKGKLKKGEKIKFVISGGIVETKMPDIDGMNVSEVEKLLKEKNINNFRIENKFDPNTEKGKIISYTPEKGTVINPSDEVIVVVSKGEDTKIKMPDVVGLKVEQAIKLLNNNNLYVEKIEVEQDETKANNTILNQNIKAGEDIDKNSKIVLIMNTKKEDVPDGTSISYTFKVNFSNAQNNRFRLTIVTFSGDKTNVIYEKMHRKNEGSVELKIVATKGSNYKVYFDSLEVKKGIIN